MSTSITVGVDDLTCSISFYCYGPYLNIKFLIFPHSCKSVLITPCISSFAISHDQSGKT